MPAVSLLSQKGRPGRGIGFTGETSAFGLRQGDDRYPARPGRHLAPKSGGVGDLKDPGGIPSAGQITVPILPAARKPLRVDVSPRPPGTPYSKGHHRHILSPPPPPRPRVVQGREGPAFSSRGGQRETVRSPCCARRRERGGQLKGRGSPKEAAWGRRCHGGPEGEASVAKAPAAPSPARLRPLPRR